MYELHQQEQPSVKLSHVHVQSSSGSSQIVVQVDAPNVTTLATFANTVAQSTSSGAFAVCTLCPGKSCL